MQTQCPACKAIFRIHKDQLMQADGLVRCGQCQEIFNGYDQVLKGRDKVAAYTPDMLKRMLLGRPNPSPMATMGWSLAITVSLLCLALQIAYVQREKLIRQPVIGARLETLCDRVAWCKITPQKDLSQIQLVSRNVYSHPNIEHALMISAVITNTAPAAQPFPVLLVSMSNVRGQIVAKRYFKPFEYLPVDAEESVMEPGKSISVNLEVMDPGQDAMAFELDFI